MGITKYIIELICVERTINDLGLIMHFLSRLLGGFPYYPICSFFNIQFNIVILFYFFDKLSYGFRSQNQRAKGFVGMSFCKFTSLGKSNHVRARSV